ILERGAQVLDNLVHRGFLRLSDVRAPGLVPLDELAWVHTEAYLDTTVTPDALAHIFGVPPETVDVDALVRGQRRAVGGTVEAALKVTRGEVKVGFNLGGGFHHAEPSKGSGFSIYNDVAVAIARVRHDGYKGRIAIVDLDFHQGNGSLVAFADDPTVFTYSVHGSAWVQRQATADAGIQLPPRTGDRAYLEALRYSLPDVFAEFKPEVVFYLAGNDVLAGDALGDFVLSPRGVLDRDLYVTRLTREHSAGLVVVIAGGYGKFAWQCTANYLRWLLTDNAHAARYPDAPLKRKFRQISRELGASELQRVDDGELAFHEEDILGDLTNRGPPKLIHGYYTRQGIEFALERFGFLPAIRERGFAQLRTEITGMDARAPTLHLYGKAHGKGAELLLVELITSRTQITAPPDLGDPPTIDSLVIEWTLLQNPTKQFEPGRPRLPGQNFPGLGLAMLLQEILIRAAHRLSLECLLSRPSHYHTAALAGPRYQFLDPRVEGRFRAMRRALAHLAIPVATRIIDEGRLRSKHGEPIPWEPGDHVLPVSERLTEYFASRVFSAKADEALRDLTNQGLVVV
ncbi:MAG: histone deacetylase, partial [Clostridia bacterium]|nr:histone deacetylase [Deltaproteobacteria bacterium]